MQVRAWAKWHCPAPWRYLLLPAAIFLTSALLTSASFAKGPDNPLKVPKTETTVDHYQGPSAPDDIVYEGPPLQYGTGWGISDWTGFAIAILIAGVFGYLIAWYSFPKHKPQPSPADTTKKVLSTVEGVIDDHIKSAELFEAHKVVKAVLEKVKSEIKAKT